MGEHVETLRAEGHENVTAEHGSTFEVTSDDYLTPAGDCILGIEADSVPSEFSDSFVSACQHTDSRVTIRLESAGFSEQVIASGHPELTFESDRSLVVRTSEYVDDRTVAVNARKSASDVSRDLIDSLASGAALDVTLTVE